MNFVELQVKHHIGRFWVLVFNGPNFRLNLQSVFLHHFVGVLHSFLSINRNFGILNFYLRTFLLFWNISRVDYMLDIFQSNIEFKANFQIVGGFRIRNNLRNWKYFTQCLLSLPLQQDNMSKFSVEENLLLSDVYIKISSDGRELYFFTEGH